MTTNPGTINPTGTPTPWAFLRNTDFAGIVTPTRVVPTRTSRPDEVALWHLANRTLLVDTEAGVICGPDGVTRAEIPQPTGFGRVYLGRIWGKIRYSPAHRVVWLAKHGPIPGMYEIVQTNGHRWDNRISNLTIVTHAEAIRHATGDLYLDADTRDDPPDVRPFDTSSVIWGRSKSTRRNIR